MVAAHWRAYHDLIARARIIRTFPFQIASHQIPRCHVPTCISSDGLDYCIALSSFKLSTSNDAIVVSLGVKSSGW